MSTSLQLIPNIPSPETVTSITRDGSIAISGINAFSWTGEFMSMITYSPASVYTLSFDSNNWPTIEDTWVAGSNFLDIHYFNGITYVSDYNNFMRSLWIDPLGGINEWATLAEAVKTYSYITDANGKLVVANGSKTLTTYSADASGNLTKLYSTPAGTYDTLYNIDSNLSGNFVYRCIRRGVNAYVEGFKVESDGSINFVNDVSVNCLLIDSIKNPNIAVNSNKVFLTVTEIAVYSFDINQSTGALTIDTSTTVETLATAIGASPDEKYCVVSGFSGPSRGIYLLNSADLSLANSSLSGDWAYYTKGFEFFGNDKFIGINAIFGISYPGNFTINKSAPIITETSKLEINAQSGNIFSLGNKLILGI